MRSSYLWTCVLLITLSGCAATSSAEQSEAAPSPWAEAVPEGKISAPVNVSYRLNGTWQPGQPVVLALSFTPRVEGRNLQFEMPDAPGDPLRKSAVTLASSKAGRATRYESSVTLVPDGPDARDLRVLVSIDIGDGRFASFFRVPLASAQAATSPVRRKRRP